MGFERFFLFSSEAASKTNPSNTPQDFTTRFTPPVTLPPNKDYAVSMIKLQGTYSWYNVEAALGNNTIRYSPDNGSSWVVVVMPDGIYSYTDIDAYVKNIMKLNGHYTTVAGVDSFNFSLSFNISTFKVEIRLLNFYQFDVYSDAFGDLIGFSNTLLTSSTNTGVRLPNINRSLDNIYIHCSLCRESTVDGVSSDVLFQYPTALLSRSYPYVFQDNNLQWSRFSTNSFSEIRFTVRDFSGKIIDLNNIHVSYTIAIKEI